MFPEVTHCNISCGIAWLSITGGFFNSDLVVFIFSVLYQPQYCVSIRNRSTRRNIEVPTKFSLGLGDGFTVSTKP